MCMSVLVVYLDVCLHFLVRRKYSRAYPAGEPWGMVVVGLVVVVVVMMIRRRD